MCGRYTITRPNNLVLRFDLASDEPDLPPRYNVAPTQTVPIVLNSAGQSTLETVPWGFQTPWGKREVKAIAPINLRAETIAEKPVFRSALQRHRCLMPADGFYEWQTLPGEKRKQPWYFRLRDGDLFGFAGIYSPGTERGTAPTGCALITTAPNELVAPAHNRMPVILPRNLEAMWLDPDVDDTDALLQLLRPLSAELMVGFPVSAAVSSARNDSFELINPL